MSPPDLIRTIYLGDRACKAICIDGWNGAVTIHVDVISRIRSSTGAWDFYTAEDILDGRLVFARARAVRFSPAGPLPNDLINALSATRSVEDPTIYVFKLLIDSVGDTGRHREVVVEIEAEELYLFDPGAPGKELRE